MKALIVQRDGSVSIREVPVPQYNDYEVGRDGLYIGCIQLRR